jgi:ribonuclease-3
MPARRTTCGAQVAPVWLEEFAHTAEGVATSAAVLGTWSRRLLGAIRRRRSRRVRRLFERAFAGTLRSATGAAGSGLDPKSRLQDFSQRSYGLLPDYRVVSEEGPPHRKVFHVEVHVNGDPAGAGEGPSKKAAEREAARDACATLLAGRRPPGCADAS